MTGDEKKLNPQIKKFEIGRINLREITIYPLAVAEEIELSDLFTNSLQTFLVAKDESDSAVVAFIMNAIKENLVRIIIMLTCGEEKGEEVMKELTNTQAGDLIEIIYKDNFGEVIKKLKDLFEKEKGKFLSERSLPDSLNDILNTDSIISSDATSVTED